MNQISELDRMIETLRDFITGEFYTPMDMRGLTAMLDIGPGEYDLFAEAVDELIREGAIVETKKGKLVSAADSGLLAGSFRASTRGFGFVTTDNAGEDLFVSRDHTHGAMHGDRVQIAVIKGEKGKEAEVIRVLERAVTELVGTMHEVHEAAPVRTKKGKKVKRPPATRFVVKPDDPKFSFRIEVLPAQTNGARDGDKVLVKLTKYPADGHAKTFAMGKVSRIFGEGGSREANYRAILHENGIKTAFDEDTVAEARSIAPGIDPAGRLDLRDKVIFTIDGADAKDFDDAISVERDGDGYLLGVHIADVSHYVRPGSALDREAMARGTSVYFTDKVVPMLPEALSNGVCSLNRDSDKYTLSALIRLDADGGIVAADFRETIISSKVRGVYHEVNDVLEQGEASEYWEKYAFLYPDTLPLMVELYEKLKKKSRTRGSLEFETAEALILLGDDGMPLDIRLRERGTSERLIEQFMLAANEAAASWLTNLGLPCIFRVHEEPSSEKVEAFITFVHNLGLDMRPLKRRKLLPSGYREVYDEAVEKGLTSVVTPVMLRSLMKAKYTAVPAPHFGLGCELYCHFTSPIRRYPDLAVHRIIKCALRGEMDEKAASMFEDFAADAAEKSNDAELRAVSAERDIEDLYKVLFLSDKVGEEHEGIISSVTSFGMFVELENTCEGLVPITTLPGWFEFDEARRQLTGGGITYSLGQKVRIRIVSCDVTTRRAEFALI